MSSFNTFLVALATLFPWTTVEAQTGAPIRLVQLNDAYGLDLGESISVWADAGLAPDVIAAAGADGAHANEMPVAPAGTSPPRHSARAGWTSCRTR